MNLIQKNRKLFTMTGIIIIIMVFTFGATKSDTYRSIARSQRIMNEVYKSLIVNYADELDVDAFTKSSINNMLSDLDPYTVYLEKEERDGLEILTHGKYGGVGIQLGKRDGHLTVISPMENSPAMRAGIMSGDIISKIDGESADDISLNEAAKMIRGQKGTIVILTVLRVDEDEPLDFHLTRADITVNDVAFAEMIDGETGYIVLTRFSKNAPKEVGKALRYLVEQNMNNLILDLRNNPGGLLVAAIEILEMMVPKGEKILWTKGRNKESNREFISRKNPVLDEKIKIAVLINEGSASASEIVSGVIQDLDRGIVIGQQSFGKGLMQSVYGIDQKRSLKITTAKYYIPSGRLIQKSGYVNEKMVNQIAEKDSLFYTKGGRSVKGGGGIYPDYIVDEPTVGALTRECWRKGFFFSFARENKNGYETLDDVLIDNSIIERFSDYITENEIDVKIEGQSQINNTKKSLMNYDSTNVDLLMAFETIELFIESQKDGLFETENKDIEKGVYSNFAQLFGGNVGRIRYNLDHDQTVRKAQKLLHNHVAYSETFLVTVDN